MRGAPRPPGVDANSLRAEHLDAICRLDQAVTGTDRRKLLLRLAVEMPGELKAVEDGGGVSGFLMARAGSRAVQIGPCVATAAAGPVLLRDACWRYAGRAVYLTNNPDKLSRWSMAEVE